MQSSPTLRYRFAHHKHEHRHDTNHRTQPRHLSLHRDRLLMQSTWCLCCRYCISYHCTALHSTKLYRTVCHARPQCSCPVQLDPALSCRVADPRHLRHPLFFSTCPSPLPVLLWLDLMSSNPLTRPIPSHPHHCHSTPLRPSLLLRLNWTK